MIQKLKDLAERLTIDKLVISTSVYWFDTIVHFFRIHPRARTVLSGGTGSPIEVERFIYAGADEIRKAEFSVRPLNP